MTTSDAVNTDWDEAVEAAADADPLMDWRDDFGEDWWPAASRNIGPMLSAALAVLRQRGYAVVPVEATAKMIDMLERRRKLPPNIGAPSTWAANTWSAMLAAAPQRIEGEPE